MNSNALPLLVCSFVAGLFAAHTPDVHAQEAQTSSTSTADQQTDAVQDASQRGSLLRVPQSTGLYLATMNHQAVVDSIFESNAYKSMKASDVAKGMKKAYRRGRTRGYEAYNKRNPFAEYLKGYGESVDSMVFQSVWQVAKQVVDNELFLYVDNDMLPVLAAVQQTQAKLTESFGLNEDFDFEDLTDEQTRAFIRLVEESMDGVECPTVIIGSRLENPAGFRGMLELARSFAEQGMRNMPEELDALREFWKVVEEDENFLLTADIELSKLPWDEILEDADNRELADAIKRVASKKRATVAMGIIDNLLIIGFAKDNARLTEFGNADKLIDLTSLKPLRNAIDQNEAVVSVFYMSDEYAQLSYSFEQFVEQIKPFIRPILREVDEIPEEDQERWAVRIETEAQEFATDIGQFVPKMGMTYAYATLADDGIRGYTRAAYEHPMLDGSKPLTLAKHAGPNTIGFFNQRMHRLNDSYGFAAKWGSRFYTYARDFGLAEMEKDLAPRSDAEAAAEEAAQAATTAARAALKEADDLTLEDFNRELTGDNAGAAKVEPTDDADIKPDDSAERGKYLRKQRNEFESIKALLVDFEAAAKRFDTTTREKLIPSLDGQEGAVFLQAITGPQSWHPDMPRSEQPLPLPLPAIVLGTTDAAKTVEAATEYWSILDGMVASAKTHFPNEDDLQEFHLFPPQRSEVKGDVSFRWNLLSVMGKIDPSISTGSLFAKDWIVMNFHPQQAEQLTESKDDEQIFGPADTDEPSISLIFYDHRVAMDGARKWIDYSETQIPTGENPFLDMAARFPAERDTLQFTEAELRDAFDRAWDFAKCMKGLSARSYAADEATVTEYLLRFEDVAAE